MTNSWKKRKYFKNLLPLLLYNPATNRQNKNKNENEIENEYKHLNKCFFLLAPAGGYFLSPRGAT
jgi:hypothetical protein